MREMSNNEEKARSRSVTRSNFRPNERCREALARTLIGFYERRVAKERSRFAKLTLVGASELVKKYNRYFRTGTGTFPRQFPSAPFPLLSLYGYVHSSFLTHSLTHSSFTDVHSTSLSLSSRLFDYFTLPADEADIFFPLLFYLLRATWITLNLPYAHVQTWTTPLLVLTRGSVALACSVRD